MKINYFFILKIFAVPNILQASQVEQKIASEVQRQATRLELKMIGEAGCGTLTQEKLQQYLQAGADLNAKNEFGYTALMEAAVCGRTAITQQLITAGADINAKNKYNGNTVLMRAADGDHTAITQQLITAGADINVKDNFGNTAFMRVAHRGRPTAIIHQLINAGADINAKDNNGNTALIWAADQGHTAIVQLLIAAGADRHIRNEKGGNKTARDYAKNKNAYDKAVTAGLAERLAERKEYLARQEQAKKFIEEELGQPQQKLSDITKIVAGYAYGPSPIDLPESKVQAIEKKEAAAVKQPNSCCVIQ